MSVRKREGALTEIEKGVVKALLSRGRRNQDIQALINERRIGTVNSARITSVKRNDNITPASDEEVDHYFRKKRAYDPKTGLNYYDDERLVRSREAMILAVHIFNSPSLNFKTEVFSMLAIVAWTYLLHEYYDRKGEKIIGKDGRSLLLSQMIKRTDCPLTKGMINNLEALKEIRDNVEHKTLGGADGRWISIFQASCLNFDLTICKLFSNELSLQKELSFALQFAKLNMEQVCAVQHFDVPEHIEALDARLNNSITDEEANDLEYQFRVVYTLDHSSKSRAHLYFIHPSSDEGKEVRNILVKHRLADDDYPHKPKIAASKIAERSGKPFTINNHTQACQKFKVRPKSGSRTPDVTNREYCVYHQAHGDYTYSDKWIEFIVEHISTDEGYRATYKFRP